MKRMGRDDQMRDIQTIEEVHVHPEEGWKGWERMFRWEIFKQLTKITYTLKMGEKNDQLRDIQTIEENHVHPGDGFKELERMIRRGRYSNNWRSSRTHWKRIKRMGEDEQQMRGIQTIDRVHLRPGDGWKGWKGMIRCGVFKQSTSSRTPWRRMKKGWDKTIRWGIFKQLTKTTYTLERDEKDRKGRSDEGYSNKWQSSRTLWRRMKMMKRWSDGGIWTIVLIHVRSGDGRRVWIGWSDEE